VGNEMSDPYCPVNKIKTVETISLSATGSRKAPNDEVTFQRLARYPSRKSEILARPKIVDKRMFLQLGLCVQSLEEEEKKKKTSIKTGTAMHRR